MSADKDKKQKTSKSRRDTAVQGTNDSSIVSKCSMAAQGYFDDPYLKNFVIKVTRRAPLIHRGYYVRSKTLDFLVKKFLQSHKGGKQVDFPDVVKRKHALIKMNDVMSQMITEETEGKDKNSAIELSSKNYKLLGVDLTQVNTLEAALKLCGVDFEVPTFLLSEVVFTYMTPRSSSAVIKWVAETFSDSVFVLYEQMNPNDAFGLFMQRHFRTIGSALKCINTFPTMQSQMDRFKKLAAYCPSYIIQLSQVSVLKALTLEGWNHCEAIDMNTFYNDIVSEAERNRVESLEPFDEYEEFHLKCSHYMMLCAYRGDGPHLLSHISNHSENIMSQYIPIHENCIKVTSAKNSATFCRFGHVTTSLDSDWLMCVGGFGEQKGKHMRVTDITLINSKTAEIVNVDPQVNNREIEVSRMHATASCLKDGTILLIGGRVSPMNLCTQMVSLRWNSGTHAIGSTLQLSKNAQNEVTTDILEDKHKPVENKHENDCDKICDNAFVMNAKSSHNVKNGENSLTRHEIMNTGDQDVESKHIDIGETGEMDCDILDGAQKLSTANKIVNDSSSCTESRKSSRGAEGMNVDSNAVNHSIDMDKQMNDKIEPGEGDCSELSVKCCIVQQSGEIPCPRWRHSAIKMEQDGTEKIIVFGGRTQSSVALDDCFSYNTASGVWTKVNYSGDPPSPRHTHSASIWNGHMIIAGGLGDDLRPLDTVHLLNLKSYSWHRLACKMLPRYSHTSCVVKDFLLLIGGVSFSHQTLGVTAIHLPTGRCTEFSLPAADKDDLVMLHGHTSVAIDNNRILLLGGGGNCFSFGTHLNSSPLLMDLTETFQLLNDQSE